MRDFDEIEVERLIVKEFKGKIVKERILSKHRTKKVRETLNQSNGKEKKGGEMSANMIALVKMKQIYSIV